jgi:hypothetical protein
VTMTEPGYTRPCPIPGHPQDDLDGAVLVADSAWSRFWGWLLHAPAERLPLPVALLAWPAAWVMHEEHVRGHAAAYATAAAVAVSWVTWRRHGRNSPHPRLLPTEAALVAAALGGWITAAVTWGPLAPVSTHLLSWAYLAGVIGGYAWLRRHEAVRAARARRDAAAEWEARKAWWHQFAAGIGLGDFDLQEIAPTYLGEEYLLTGSPYGDRASAIAGNSSAITERWEHLEGLPYGSIDIDRTTHPGQLRASIRRKDPSVSADVRHPMTDPESPYAGWFPVPATIREPIPFGVIPETGEPMEAVLWDREGGKVIGIYAATGMGKTTVLNDFRERVTAMPDATLIQVNGAKVGDETAWAPLAAATAAGDARFEAGEAEKIMRTLEWGQHLITERSRTHVLTGDSVFQPTPADPAVVIMIDEIDEVAKIPGAPPVLEFLASKLRSSAVVLVIAGQRATNQWTGGGGVKANLSTVLLGSMARGSESRHATGAEYDIPDISEYSRGQAGFFQVWDVRGKRVRTRGRAFNIGNIRDQQRIIRMREDDGRPVLPGPALVFDDAEETTTDEGSRPTESPMRALLANALGLLNGSTPQPAPKGPAGSPAGSDRPRAVPGVPPEAMPILMRLLSAPEGTTAPAAGLALGKQRETGRTYLNALCDAGIAELTGGGRGSRFRAVRKEPADAPEPRRYLTLAAHAEAVVNGRIGDVDPEQRALMEQVHDMIRRQRAGDSS